MNGFNLSAFAVREKALTLFLIVAVAAAGLVAFLQLGRAEDPSFTIKVMTVTAVWPGATPKEMQDLVAEPLEKRLQELDHYDRVETFTRPGAAYLTVQFKDDTPGSAVPEIFYQARKKLGDEARNLPAGVLGPFINDEYSDIDFALYALKAKGLAPRLLVRQAEALRERLLHVPGVLKVNITGEQPERIFVRFDYARLATLGVGAQTIFDALQRQNLVAPSGAVETRGPEAYVRLDRGFDDVEAVRQTPIAANGRTLTLGELATVERGYEDPPTFLVRSGGEPALVLAVVMQKGWNGLTLGTALDREERAIATTLPLGVSFTKISDQAKNIREAVGEFTLKFFVALAVVMAVSFVALGFRVGLVVAAAVPLTLAAVFVIMLITGRVFDRITLGALILSLGLLVDDAIIAIEMMVVKMQEGLKREEAAAFAWTVTAAPMLAGTLVTIIGLMPVGFAQSSAGEYAGNIFWMVAFALLASWVVAVVFTPYLGVQMLPKIKPVAGGHDAIYATRNYARLGRLVTWCVDRRGTVALGVVALFLFGVVGLAAVKKQFFPNSDRPELIVEVYRPHGTGIGATTQTVAKIERWLKTKPEAQIVTSYIGQGAPRFFLSLNPELPDPSFAKLIVQTPDAKGRDRLKASLRAAIAQGLAPEARLRVTQLLFGPPVPYPVSFRVVGPDIDQLRTIAARVRDVMASDPGMRDVNLDWGGRTPALRLVLDQARLRLLGLTPKDAADQLQFLLSGAPVTQVREDIRTVEVTAQAIDPQRLDPSRLADLTLTTRDGRAVPVSQVGDLRVVEEDPLLKRRDRESVITVRGDIDEGLEPPDVTKALLPKLKPIMASLPAGYRIDTGGSVEEAGKANVALAKVFPLMLLLMLGVIMIQVRNFRGLLMVFLTAPLGLVGAAPTLLLFAQPFGFNAILGLIGLAGILMRNTLILLGQIEADQKEGMSPREAVIEATVRRSRPVILTAAAAMLAFVPLTLSSFWGPLAFTLIGGVGVGTVLTLLFLPALYAIFFRVARTGPDAPAAGSGRASRSNRIAGGPFAPPVQATTSAGAWREAMLTAPIAKTLFGLTLPVIAVIAAQTFVAVLEAYWVSRLGTAAVAGVSLVLPLFILMGTMSNGGIGGGVSSAISRALGAGRSEEADRLLLHSIVIALGFGLIFALGAVLVGRSIYLALGGSGETLAYALTYSAWVFGGAPLIWVVNLMASAMRGAGEVKLPAVVSLVGAVTLVPLSPALIFGLGPLPRLGVGGAGAATLIFYLGALVAYLVHFRRAGSALRLRRTAFGARDFAAILGVGLTSAVGTLVASLTVVGMTGAAGRGGAPVLAGYGIASRIDSLLVPLLFGLGSGVVTLVGVATGAGDHRRGDQITLFASVIAFASTEAIGLVVAAAPILWMGLFSKDPVVLADGAAYLRIAGPFYGFFGVGLMLYFASQGRSRMLWPFIGTALRLVVTLGLAWGLALKGAALPWVFAAVSVGSVVFGAVNVAGFLIDSSRRHPVTATQLSTVLESVA